MRKYLVLLSALLFILNGLKAQKECSLVLLSELLNSGKYTDAIDEIKFIEKNCPQFINDTSYLFLKSEAFIGNRNYSHALKVVNTLVNDYPSFGHYYQSARVNLSTGNTESAKSLALKAHEYDPESIVNNLLLSSIYWQLKQYDSSELYLLKVPVEHWSGFEIGIYQRILSINGDWEMAFKWKDSFLSIGDSDSYILSSFRLFHSLGMTDSVLHIAPQLLEILTRIDNEVFFDFRRSACIDILQYAQRIAIRDESMFISTISLSRKFLTLDSIENNKGFYDDLFRSIGSSLYNYGDYTSAYYYFSYINDYTYADYYIVAQIGKRVPVSTWLIKKANKVITQR